MTVTAARPIFDADPLAIFPERWADGETQYLSTHCMFPSGDHVVVGVRRDAGRGTSTVTDAGCGWEAIAAAGLNPDSATVIREAMRTAEAAGLHFGAGEFYRPAVPDAELAAMVLILANEVQGCASRVIARARQAPPPMLEDRLVEVLEREFGAGAVTRDAEVLGESTRTYAVTAAVSLRDNRLGLFRAVSPHAASLFACHSAFGDIARLPKAPIRVAVVDSLDDWPAADANFLMQVSTHILDMNRNPQRAVHRLAS